MKVLQKSRILILVSLLFFINQLSKANVLDLEDVAVLDLVVTSSASSGPGSLYEIIEQTNVETNPVKISFVLGNPIINLPSRLFINKASNQIVIIDGKLPNGENVELVNNGASIGITIHSNRTSLKNIKFTGFNTSLSVTGSAEKTKIEGCTFSNSAVALSISGMDTEVGNENVFTNTTNTGEAISITTSAVNTKLGKPTTSYEDYNYVSGFKYGIKSYSDVEVNSFIFGGNSPDITTCDANESRKNQTSIHIFNVYEKQIKIGESNTIFSNIFSEASQSHIYLQKVENVKIDNNSVGIDPRWCDNYLPTTTKAAFGIQIRTAQKVEIGKAQRNVVGLVDDGINTYQTNEASVNNNLVGINEVEKEYGVKQGLFLRGSNYQVKNNLIGSYTTTGLLIRAGRENHVSNNYIGVSKTTPKIYTLGANTIGISLALSSSTFDQNHIFAKKTGISATQSASVVFSNNILGATVDGEPIDEVVPIALQLGNSCNDITFKNNRVMGKFTDGIHLLDYYVGTTERLDSEGNSYLHSNVKIYSNYFHEIVNQAIYLGRSYKAEVGSADIENSGNTIMRAKYGIQSRVYHGVGSLLKAHRNYIGIDKDGIEGAIGISGIFMAVYPVGDVGHEIGDADKGSGNTITNCASNALDLRSVDQVKVSGNSIYGNGNSIFYNVVTNRVNGNSIIAPAITEVTSSGDFLTIAGTSNYNGKIEVFRKKDSLSGAFEYVGSTTANPDNTWQLQDLLIKQINFQGYLVTETTSENQTSNLSNVILNPTDEENYTASAHYVFNPTDNFATLSKDPSKPPIFVDGDHIYFIDNNLDDKGSKITLYNSFGESIPVDIVKLQGDKYSFYLETTNVNFLKYDIHKLEVASENGSVKSLRFIQLAR